MLEFRNKFICCFSSVLCIEGNKQNTDDHAKSHDDNRDDNAGHIEGDLRDNKSVRYRQDGAHQLFAVNMRTTVKLQRVITQDRQSLIPGNPIEVLEIGEIIELVAERKKLRK